VRLIVWCKNCQHQPEPNSAEHAHETAVLERKERLVCARCGSRQVDMVRSGTKRQEPAIASSASRVDP
jgi:Zn finger protein HypA/HybF involved in hydrogenase expression